MAVSFEVTAEFREDMGKGASRRLRRQGKVPAVIYGGKDEARSITLDHQKLLLLIANEAFFSHILTIKIGKKEQDAIIKDMQRHPSKPRIMHVDFQRITRGEKLKMSVPLHFTGEDLAPGVKAGGIVSHLRTDLEIACLPRNLPEFIEVDVSQLEIDEMIHLSEVKLPKGVEAPELALGSDHDQAVVSIQRPAKVEVDEEETEAATGEETPEAEADDDSES